MKKIFLVIALIATFFNGYAQNPSKFKEGIDTKLVILDTLTTTQINNLNIGPQKSAFIYNATLKAPVYWNGTKWITLNDNTDIINSLTAQDKVFSGNVVWVDSTFQFISRNFVYAIKGTVYSPDEKLHTLQPQNENFGRIDVFVADSDTGEIQVITGTPSATPQEPIIQFGTQLLIDSVFVPSVISGETVPQTGNQTSFITDLISDETNAEPNEWNLITTSTNTNVNNTAPPLSKGTKYITFGTNATGITKWKKDSYLTYDANGYLKFNLKLSQPLLNLPISGNGYGGEGSLIRITLSNNVSGHSSLLYAALSTLELSGLDNNSTNWQSISISMVNFGYLINNQPAEFDTISLEFIRCGQISIDNMRVQATVNVPSTTGVARTSDIPINDGADGVSRYIQQNEISGLVLEPPFLNELVPDTYLPSTTGNFILRGSYFTPSMSVVVEGHTINYKTFISSNEVIVNLTTSANEGLYDVTLNNGLSVTYNDQLQVVNGTIYQPTILEWTNVVEPIDLTVNTEANVKTFGSEGHARWNRLIDITKASRIDYFSSLSPLGSYTEENYKTIRLTESISGDYYDISFHRFANYTEWRVYKNGVVYSSYFGGYSPSSSPFKTVSIRNDLTTFYIYLNNTLAYTFPAGQITEDYYIDVYVKRVNVKNIKYIDLSYISGGYTDYSKLISQFENDANYLQDAPSNGNEYVRKDGDWQVATGGGGGSGHTIQDNGVSKTARTNLNFKNFVVDDNAGNNSTDITAVVAGVPLTYNYTAVGAETSINTGVSIASNYQTEIYYGNAVLSPTIDYTLSYGATTTINFTFPLEAGYPIRVVYNSSSAPNAITDTDDVPEGTTNLYADSNATNQGNTFNGANQLVKLDGTGKLPAIDGSNLTNLPSVGDMLKSENLSGLANYSTARTNLGLGNVTNESKATMFTSPTFTGTPILPSTFIIGANSFIRSGAHNLTFTTTATTALTLPTSGTLYSTGTADVSVADGGTGRSTGTTAYSLIATGTTATGAQQTLANGATTQLLVGGGVSALPVWTTATGTGAPVRATSPTLVTPDLGTPTTLVATNATGKAEGLTAGNSNQTNALKSATTTINVDAATAPTTGQVLTATSSTTATWQTPSEVIQIACSDLVTDIATGTSKAYFRMPYAMTLTDVRVSLLAAGTVTGITVDINESGTTILSTKLTTDATEKTSTTAVTAAVISDASLADDSEITIDFDAVPTGGKGVIVTLKGNRI